MLEEAKYSIIQYCNEVTKDNLKKYTNLIKRGIIVHLLLKEKFKEKEDRYIYAAIENKLLYVYENQENISDSDKLIAVDGEIIEEEIYKKICGDKNCMFNHHQYDIITAPINSNIIVVSGAGTGKTTTMINRLIYLRKIDPKFRFEQAVLITFTNKASREMRERLLNLLEKYYIVTKDAKYLDMMDEAAQCNISTIHGFSKKIINLYGKNININKKIKIKSFRQKRENAITEALNIIYKEHKDLYEIIKYYPIYELENKMLAIWDKLDNYSIDINSKNYDIDFGQDDKNFSQLICKVIGYAQKILDEDKEEELEISDLMKKLSNRELIENIDEKYKIIMVDEFQDSDNIQIEFIAELCKAVDANLLVVGDEKQSIYRFRGAEYTAFDKLKKLLKESKKKTIEYEMVRNYRTEKMLLEDINKIFINVDKKVECFNYKEKDYIYSLMEKDKENNIEYIDLSDFAEKADFYSKLRDSKDDKESIAVLLRSNNDIREFKEFCDRHEIPCRVEESGGFFRHEAVRDFYVMILALIENSNLTTLYSFIETPYICEKVDKNIILKGTEEEKREYLNSILISKEWDTYKKLVNEKNILNLIDEIINNLNPIRNYYEKTLINAKKSQKKYKEVAYMKSLEYKLNLEHLVYLIKDKFSDSISSIFQIEQYLKVKIATDNTIDARRLGNNYDKKFIQCLTVHKAKGLEYDYLVMDNLKRKFIKNFKDVDIILRVNGNKIMVGYKLLLGRDNDEYSNNLYFRYLKDENEEIIGEETRLLYVALTRCKKKLYLNMESEIAANTRMNTWKSLIGGVSEYV